MAFPNPYYRSKQLKVRLENHYINELIAFTKVSTGDKGCITYNLVYIASIYVTDAVTYAYKLGCKDKYEDVALLLHCIIQLAFKESTSLPWPPTDDNREVKSLDELPYDLIKFLNSFISGEAICNSHSRWGE